MKNFYKSLSITCVALLFILGATQPAPAQFSPIIYAGVVQIAPGPSIPNCPFITADTLITVINPIEVEEADAAAQSDLNESCPLTGTITVFTSEGEEVGFTDFTVKSKGNATFSLTSLINPDKISSIRGKMRKLAYEIRYTTLVEGPCTVMAEPTVEAKEVIFLKPVLLCKIRKDAEDVFLNSSFCIKTMSETALFSKFVAPEAEL
jgi:hypothetical protein